MEAAKTKTSIERMPAGWHVRLCRPSEDCLTNGFRTRTIVESELADLGGKSPVPDQVSGKSEFRGYAWLGFLRKDDERAVM